MLKEDFVNKTNKCKIKHIYNPLDFKPCFKLSSLFHFAQPWSTDHEFVASCNCYLQWTNSFMPSVASASCTVGYGPHLNNFKGTDKDFFKKA